LKRHPLPISIAVFSIAACVASVCAGLAGVEAMHHRGRLVEVMRQGRRPLPAAAKPVPEGDVIGPMIGVAGQSAVVWNKTTGIRASLSVSYVSMAEPPTKFIRWAELDADGARPIIEILPRGRSLQSIASGKEDGWLRALKAGINEPVVVAFAPEANGEWYTWGKQPKHFRKAWHHVWRVLGTHNITWLWQMSARRAVAAYWPGRRYVAWAGLDGYFATPDSNFSTVFGSTIRAIRSVTNAPVLLSETAVGPLTGHVALDIRQLFADAHRKDLIGVIWFDRAQSGSVYHQDWLLTTMPGALAAFRTAAAAYQAGASGP
jgi:hypothetical protein